MSFGSVLGRGALAGALAGLAAALVSWLMVEPVLQRAIALEQARGGHDGHQHEMLLSRSMQVVGGVITAVVVGVLLGLIFAVVLGSLRHRLAPRSAFGRSVLLAAIGFGVFALLPAIKYPANPPGVGDPTTVEQRTLLYGVLLLAGMLIVLAIGTLRGALAHRGWHAPARSTVAGMVGVLLVTLVLVLLPASPDHIPADMPAALVWNFRLRSLAQHAALWSVLGVVTGLLVQRRSTAAPTPRVDGEAPVDRR